MGIKYIVRAKVFSKPNFGVNLLMMHIRVLDI